MWNCKKGKFYYLEQILKTTETGKVLTCESERSKQLKSESFTLGTDQYKNIPISSVTTVSSNHAVIYIDLLLGNPNGVAGKKKGSLWGAARTSTGSPSGAWKCSKGKLSLKKLHWKYLVVLYFNIDFWFRQLPISTTVPVPFQGFSNGDRARVTLDPLSQEKIPL